VSVVPDAFGCVVEGMWREQCVPLQVSLQVQRVAVGQAMREQASFF
jgi:hypothetical protein